jgi:diguanylate cyclase (GGDEF)-like protein
VSHHTLTSPTLLAGAAVGAAAGAAIGWATTARHWRTRCHAQLTTAATDGLTGLWRRDGWRSRALVRLPEYDYLALMDVDGFKPVNDIYGHEAGDQVLHALAARLRTELGDTALLGRLGGDEFTWLATAFDPDTLDHLHTALTAPITLTSTTTVTMGVSIGLVALADLPSGKPATNAACLGRSASPRAASSAASSTASSTAVLTEALAAADLAMYEIKASGGGWRRYNPTLDPVRPAASISRAPRRRIREHGPGALR